MQIKNALMVVFLMFNMQFLLQGAGADASQANLSELAVFEKALEDATPTRIKFMTLLASFVKDFGEMKDIQGKDAQQKIGAFVAALVPAAHQKDAQFITALANALTASKKIFVEYLYKDKIDSLIESMLTLLKGFYVEFKKLPPLPNSQKVQDLEPEAYGQLLDGAVGKDLKAELIRYLGTPNMDLATKDDEQVEDANEVKAIVQKYVMPYNRSWNQRSLLFSMLLNYVGKWQPSYVKAADQVVDKLISELRSRAKKASSISSTPPVLVSQSSAPRAALPGAKSADLVKFKNAITDNYYIGNLPKELNDYQVSYLEAKGIKLKQAVVKNQVDKFMQEWVVKFIPKNSTVPQTEFIQAFKDFIVAQQQGIKNIFNDAMNALANLVKQSEGYINELQAAEKAATKNPKAKLKAILVAEDFTVDEYAAEVAASDSDLALNLQAAIIKYAFGYKNSKNKKGYISLVSKALIDDCVLVYSHDWSVRLKFVPLLLNYISQHKNDFLVIFNRSIDALVQGLAAGEWAGVPRSRGLAVLPRVANRQ